MRLAESEITKGQQDVQLKSDYEFLERFKKFAVDILFNVLIARAQVGGKKKERGISLITSKFCILFLRKYDGI